MRIIAIIFVLSFPIAAKSQFTLLTDELKGSREGDATWTDIDSDGDIDILIFGNDINAIGFTKFFRNDDLVFTEIDVENFPVLFDGSIDWTDYNNDGEKDIGVIAFSGTDETVISRIYTFNENFQNSGIQLHGVTRGSIDWGDYDQDGFADLLIVGQDSESTSITKLYRNAPSGFTEVDLPEVTGVSFGDAAWADVNGDGKLDFIITGVTGTSPETTPAVTQLYFNTGDGFEKSADLEGVWESSVDWGDADNDGDLDLLLTGLTNEPAPMTSLLLNNNGVFTNSLVNLPGILEGFANWGDYDNDGDLDVLIVGNTFGVPGKVFKVFENEGSLTFTEIFDASGVGQSSGGWGDFNNDGYLDIFINGQEEDFDIVAAIYLNDLGDVGGGKVKNTNMPPSVPVPSDVFVNGGTAKLMWQESEDDFTPNASLSYNVKVYKGEDLIISSESLSSGKRSLVEPGNAGLNTSYRATGLSNGTYRWVVQAIDNTFMASAFSAEETFEIDGVVVGLPDSHNENISIYPNPTTDYLFGYAEGSILTMFDLAGRSIEIVINEDRLQLSHLQSGSYVLKVSFGNQLTVHRIMKN